MTSAKLTFRAGLSRLVIGASALVLLPLAYPLARGQMWVLIAYLVAAAIEQVLIKEEIGVGVRPFLAGLVDMMILTFLVHRLGSSATVVASLYFFAGILNALVVGLRVGVTLAAINALAYNAVVWSEHAGWLPFAPDVPELSRMGRPSFEASITATTLVTLLLLASVTVVGFLVHAVHTHEAELTSANAKLEDLTQRDPLTGLYNRRHLFTRLEHELARQRRGHPLAIIMLDLDAFKHVNDEQGHQRGDELLREIATAILASTRVIDVAARYGGDEFMLILPDTEIEQAQVVADRVAENVREVGLRFDADKPVTASVGLATALEDDTAEALIRRADESAYGAKQSGGNRVVSIPPERPSAMVRDRS
jgi:diguanylate cyclase (GGDEF)-like protein